MQRLARIVVIVTAATVVMWAQSPPRTFKVATWNIRSGMGKTGFDSRAFDHTTLNCTDRAKPLNAWGVGMPQQELERIKNDPSIVALAVQEAWNCAFPEKINGVLGFKKGTREQEGVALFARHGFSGDPVYHRIDKPSNRWLIGGNVCLDAACSAAVPIFSTHWGGKTAEDYSVQARQVLDFMKTQPEPHVFMGDLNVWRVDQWNPEVPCAGPDHPERTRAIELVEAAGYTDAWKATQTSEGWTGMASRKGCGRPDGNLFKRIDYVNVKGVPVVSTTRFARTPPGADSPSDHVGLIAEIGWPPKPTSSPVARALQGSRSDER